ncbi:sirohydrochlorin chelatase [Rhodococcus sp. RS1C4]|nr:sirohydrochlorin chelatase [Rhodococcus sp. RS1C4]OZC48661.1 sirohydrochlorin chelatase [Rhodococcus sp. RS1C4]
MSVLIAVAHGSRDPRSAETVAAVVDGVRLRRPDLDVRVAYLDLTEPAVGTVIGEVAAEGHSSAVVVPLLLGSAFHARVDLPGILDAARVRYPWVTFTQADVLGDDSRLVDVLRARVLGTGVDRDDPDVAVAVAAVGSSDSLANRRTRALASRLLVGTEWSGAQVCFATGVESSPADAVARLTAAGPRRVVVAPWFLAPGLLIDRVLGAFDNSALRADVLGDHPLVADVVSSRFDEAPRYQPRIDESSTVRR